MVRSTGKVFGKVILVRSALPVDLTKISFFVKKKKSKVIVIVIVIGHADSERVSAHYHLCSPPADRGARQGTLPKTLLSTLPGFTRVEKMKNGKVDLTNNLTISTLPVLQEMP